MQTYTDVLNAEPLDMNTHVNVDLKDLRLTLNDRIK